MLRIALMAGALALAATPAVAENQRVSIVAVAGNPAAEPAREGILEGLARSGYREGENVDVVFEEAEDEDAIGDVAQRVVDEEPAAIVPVSTSATTVVSSLTQDIPVVFTAVTDPLGAGFIDDALNPGTNLTGVSDLPPLSENLALIREIVPQARALGILFNPEESASQRLIESLETLAPGAGFDIVEMPVSSTDEVEAAMQSAAGEVQVMFIPADETVLKAFDAIVAVTEEADIPLFTGAVEAVERGAVAAIGFDYFDVGVLTGELVARILQGEEPANVAVTQATGTYLVVNPGAGERMGVRLSPGLVARASEVFD